MDPTLALIHLGGASRWKPIVDTGVTDGSLRAAVRRGDVLRCGPVYALPGTASDVLLAAELGGSLTCSSAAVAHGLDVLVPPVRPHIAIARNSRRTCRVAVLHRTGCAGTRIAPVTVALLAALRCLPSVHALVLVDSALRAGLASIEHLRAALVGPGSVRARGVLGMADASSGSVLETVARVAMRATGLPVACQVWIRDVGRVDFVVGGWLVVEIDGFAYHSDRASYREDRRRANHLVEQGFVLLRFSYEDVMHRMDWVVATVWQVFLRGPR